MDIFVVKIDISSVAAGLFDAVSRVVSTNRDE